MDSEVRARFHKVWSPDLVARVRGDLDRRIGRPCPFPIAETPLFLPADLRERFASAAEDIVAQLSRPAFIAAHEASIPPQYAMGGRKDLPHVAQIDFAVARDADGRLVPRLVELQGFPSLYAFQIMLTDVWATHLSGLPGLPERWGLFFHGRRRHEAMALLRDTIVGTHDPEEVILLDLAPDEQKTFPDFAATQRWFGVDAVCPSDLKRDGDRIYRVKDGKTIRVRRFYHRIIIDEMERKAFPMPFKLNERLDVEWVPHPEWWWIWSKRSMLDLEHEAVPKTTLVSELDETPADLSNYVLKPLWSFAGGGVNVDPTPEDVAAIPADQRSGWVLQEKIRYADAFQTPDGNGVKAEVRMMFVRRDRDTKMQLLMNLVRLSRGKMIGVNFNRDLPWTGASVGMWPAEGP